MSAPNAAEDSAGLYPALGRLPSGVYILTIGQGDEATGMLVSWVQQAGFEPPMLSLSVKKGRPLSERLEGGEPFAINILAEGQTHYLKHFGKGFEPGEPAFEGLQLATTATGVPALADALAVLECRVATAADASDHRVLVADIIGGRLQSTDAPMVHVRKRGDHY